jgi:hypothetical protein
MKYLLNITVAVSLLFSLPSFAGHEGHSHDHQPVKIQDSINISVKANEAVIQVSGVVCSYCSFGIQKKLSRLPFVDRTKYNKGSIVDIETQRITIAIKPGETFDVKQVYKSVLDGGYNPVKAYVGGSNNTIIYDADGEVCTASC